MSGWGYINQWDLYAERGIHEVAWQTGGKGASARYSLLHIWNARGTRMLCGVTPNWRIGNFGHTHSGKCSRCFTNAKAVSDALGGEAA